jgi:hypothetical protein
MLVSNALVRLSWSTATRPVMRAVRRLQRRSPQTCATILARTLMGVVHEFHC